jgi:hypothetical protein
MATVNLASETPLLKLGVRVGEGHKTWPLLACLAQVLPRVLVTSPVGRFLLETTQYRPTTSALHPW